MANGKDTQFLKIDRSLEQVINNTAFLAKVKGQDTTIIHMLEKEYEKDIANLDNAVALCFYQWFLSNDKINLDDTNFVFQVTFKVINVIDDVLEVKPEYWILKILRLKILSYINFNENDLMDELEELIKLQKQNEKMPYYFVTEVLLSSICHSKDKPERARELLKDVLQDYHEKVDVLIGFFKGFVMEYISMAKRSGEEDILEMLNEIYRRLFNTNLNN